MKLDCRTLSYLILVIVIAILIFVPLVQAMRSDSYEGYLPNDYASVSNGYTFDSNVNTAYGCGC